MKEHKVAVAYQSESGANAVTDAELVAETLKEPEVFGTIMRRYNARLSRYVRRLTSLSRDEVEHIIQDTFVKTYRNLNDFDPRLPFSSWIYRITHNETISYLRSSHRTSVHQSVSLDGDDELANTLSDEFDMSEEADRRLTGKMMRELLANLRPDYREVLVLKFLEEKDYSEISDILHKPLGTVGTLIHRAKKALVEEARERGVNLTEYLW